VGFTFIVVIGIVRLVVKFVQVGFGLQIFGNRHDGRRHG